MVRRKWALAILAVWVAIVISTLTWPAFQEALAMRAASACSQHDAGEAVARLLETRRNTAQRLAATTPADCAPRAAAR